MAKKNGKSRFQKGKHSAIKAPKNAKQAEAVIYLLDRFSAEQIEQWQNRYDQFYDYHWEEYSFYSNARSRRATQLKEALQSQCADFKFQNWYRFIAQEYSNQPLSSRGSRVNALGGRFNFGLIDEVKFPNFAALYIAENEKTADIEKFPKSPSPVHGLNPTDYGLRERGSYLAARISGELDTVLDISNDENLKPFLKNQRCLVG